jgi:hypothetical protein
MVVERDALNENKARVERMDQEHRMVRFSVLEEFLQLRNAKDSDFNRWDAILEPDATLRLPSICVEVEGECNSASHTKSYIGADQIIQASNDDEIVQKLEKGSVEVQCDRCSLMMQGNTAVLDWTATSLDASSNKVSKR